MHYYGSHMNKTNKVVNISDILELVEDIPINNKLETEVDDKVALENHNKLVERVGLD